PIGDRHLPQQPGQGHVDGEGTAELGDFQGPGRDHRPGGEVVAVNDRWPQAEACGYRCSVRSRRLQPAASEIHLSFVEVSMLLHMPLFADGGDAGALVLFLGLACVGLLVYFLPFVIAMLRGHPNTMAIFVLTFFLGWSFIGWVIAL